MILSWQQENLLLIKIFILRRVHMPGTLLGRRKDENGRLYLSITIH
jgi:hypothetical protein